MTKKYKELEDHIINIFKNEKYFKIEDKSYTVLEAAKPRPRVGECKTDVIAIFQEDESKEKYILKLSVKRKTNNEFQENKVTAEKAEAYFGSDWTSVLIDATTSIKSIFENRPLIYQSGKHPTKPNSITLGWKLEITSKKRPLSVKAPLNDEEIRNYVFKGINQPKVKRDAYVNEKIVENSGVAEYLISTEIEDINSILDILRQAQDINTMHLPDIYLVFTANNYRTDVDSADGQRSLAVYINWECINGKLTPEFVYNMPLKYTGERDIKPILINALNKLGKRNPQEFNIENDVCSSKIVLE